MYQLQTFLEDLNKHLSGSTTLHGNIIRKHSKKLDDLGDISFPLDIKKWSQIIDKTRLDKEAIATILDYLSSTKNLNVQLDLLVKISENWSLTLDRYKLKDSDVHLYFQRPRTIQLCVQQVLLEAQNYGFQFKTFQNKFNVVVDSTVSSEVTTINLTELRMVIIQAVTTNILNKLTVETSVKENNVRITFNSNEKQTGVLICGSVLNETGIKDSKTTADDLYQKRSLDLQLMAQHKYGVQLKSSWRNYFTNLGKASVIIELLQNRTHKATKVTLNDLQTTNKGPSFIFYNCARISALLKQFDDRVSQRIFPELPSIENIDFGLLSQSEEWELVYVFILQFPMVVTSTVSEIEMGVLSIHHLVLFLSNLSSVFSVYYRRIKILTSPKEHLLPVMYARIYLIKAIQQIFHTTLDLLGIEPVKEM